MLTLNDAKNSLEGVLKLSDCEREFVVKWLSGSSQASFFIGDKPELKNEIKSFIFGEKKCYLDLNSYVSYLKKIKIIVEKYSSMFYGPFDKIDYLINKFSNINPSNAYVILSYDGDDRYIRILNDKNGYKENVINYGELPLKNGDDFRHSFLGGITNIKISKENNEYKIFINLINDWRDVLMQEKGKKVDLESLVNIFNDEMAQNINNGNSPEIAACIFGIKYTPLLKNNESKFSYIDIVNNSSFNSNTVIDSLNKGMLMSSSILWSKNVFDDEQNGDMNFNVYGIHIKYQNSAMDPNNPHVCIGWSPLGDISAIANKNDMKILYSSKWPKASSNTTGANVGQIWMFKDTIKINDYIVFFDRGIAHIGRVTGNYEYLTNVPNQSGDYVNNRKVEWIKDIPYKDLPQEYAKSALTRKSVFKLDSYKPLIQEIINGNKIVKDEYDDVDEEDMDENGAYPLFNFTKSPITDGQNLIVYGTPGCGKSYYVEHTLLDGYSKENYIRTTFYQDYTNTDFVGQILPVVEGDKVTYKFNPGPFTLALEQAIRKPNERIALVIEELNRGSAASIFSDIFQLLDRKEGVSEYGITNVNIINYLKEKFEGVYTFKEIRLPGNLSIYATMNASDQNVFTLDTAFKRRWKFKKLINEFAKDHKFKDKYIPGADITWEELVNDINEYILECSSGLNSEDKQLGVYFVDENGMRKEKVDASDPEAVNAFAYKVLEYLWSDVAKFDRNKWFADGIKSLDELVKEYKEKGLEVFVDGIFNK